MCAVVRGETCVVRQLVLLRAVGSAQNMAVASKAEEGTSYFSRFTKGCSLLFLKRLASSTQEKGHHHQSEEKATPFTRIPARFE